MAPRPRVLVLLDHYLPGERAGGPVQSVAALVAALADEFEFRIATSDRDLGDTGPYPGIPAGAWTDVEGTPVLRLPAAGFGRRLRAVLADGGHDALYLNSLFSRRFSIRPAAFRRLGLARRVPLLLAPRGELGRGALAIHAGRKRAYLAAARLAGFYEGVLWHASTSAEADEIRAQFPGARVAIALPFGRGAADAAPVERPTKTAGRLAALFLSRLSPKKNLDGALRALARVRGEVELSVVGPCEDAGYLRACEEAAAALPPNVRVSFRGAVAHAEVAGVLARHDAFLLPTRGENFGQAIAEALAAGCPAILGRETPFAGLEAAGAGWIVDPGDAGAIAAAIQAAVDAGPGEWERRSASARAFGNAAADRDGAIRRHRELFRGALARV